MQPKNGDTALAQVVVPPLHAVKPPPDGQRYLLRLYVAGMTPRSSRAIANTTAMCEKHLKGRYDLAVIDVYQEPVRTPNEKLIALPMLIKHLPLPARRLVGDVENSDRALFTLDLKDVG